MKSLPPWETNFIQCDHAPCNCSNFDFFIPDTDEELALNGSFDQDLRSYHRLHWETEFKPVAQQLLKRIQSHHSPLEPLPTPSF